ncbi:lipoate--protein ligase family protein [Geitlerinema sp. P-1104]|nr:biotin/lipoate A/B protein ligase family protein [Geitlerinema sp. P-1104]NMG58065.1 lipoate--protein ligase family protein [Geitlerinema sp. P-1104]
MAADAWLLDQHRQGMMPPMLRFYTWSSPTLSLGYHQRRYPTHWREITWQGQPLSWVRRPTGGRAVLHEGDLTYSLVTSGWPGRREAVYRQLCGFLQLGWQRLGVPLRFGDRPPSGHNPNCFATATAADLVTPEGYKFIGSAQLWRRGAVLQHGSMQLIPNPVLQAQLFGSQEPPPSLLRDPLPKDINHLVSTLTQAAEDAFGVRLQVQPFTPEEVAAIKAQATTWRVDPHRPHSLGAKD